MASHYERAPLAARQVLLLQEARTCGFWAKSCLCTVGAGRDCVLFLNRRSIRQETLQTNAPSLTVPAGPSGSTAQVSFSSAEGRK